MWLLDANMPLQLIGFLSGLGINADSAITRGWSTLSNGALVGAAVQAGFKTLLTRDRLFGESASRTLRTYPEFCVVLITLPQLRSTALLRVFKTAWDKQRIVPVPGRAIEWP